MQRVIFELVFKYAHWFCVGATVDRVIIACKCTFSSPAAAGFGGSFVRTYSAAGTAVIGIAAMDVDADVLAIPFTD